MRLLLIACSGRSYLWFFSDDILEDELYSVIRPQETLSFFCNSTWLRRLHCLWAAKIAPASGLQSLILTGAALAMNKQFQAKIDDRWRFKATGWYGCQHIFSDIYRQMIENCRFSFSGSMLICFIWQEFRRIIIPTKTIYSRSSALEPHLQRGYLSRL